MVEIGPLTGSLGTVALILVTLLGLIWRKYDKLDGRYVPKIDDLQGEAWSEASSELGELFIYVDERIEDGEDDLPDDMTREDRIHFVVQDELNRQELDGLDESLAKIDDAHELLRDCRRFYKAAGTRWGAAVAVTLVLMVIVAAVGRPFWVDQIGVFLGTTVAAAFVSGAGKTLTAVDTEGELKSRWEELEFE